MTFTSPINRKMFRGICPHELWKAQCARAEVESHNKNLCQRNYLNFFHLSNDLINVALRLRRKKMLKCRSVMWPIDGVWSHLSLLLRFHIYNFHYRYNWYALSEVAKFLSLSIHVFANISQNIMVVHVLV